MGLRGWGKRGVREDEREGEGAQEEDVGGRCTGSLVGSDSDVALLLPSLLCAGSEACWESDDAPHTSS